MTLDQLEAKAREDFPTEARGDALRSEAVKQQAEIRAKASPSNQKIHAAATFLGFYWMNERERPSYCTKIGVDISRFVDQFNAANSDALMRAKALMKNSPMTEEALFEKIAAQLAIAVERDMREVSASENVTQRQVCERIRKDPGAAVAGLIYAKANPTGYQSLMGPE